MGIRGLDQFIYRECPKALKKVKFAESVALYKERTGKVPILLIDSHACSRHLYSSIPSSGTHLALYREFEEQLIQLIQLFKRHGIRAVFLFDGSTARVISVEARKKAICEVSQKIAMATQLVEKGHVDEAQGMMRYMVPKIEFFKYVVRYTGCEILQTMKVGEEEILEFIAKNGCYGVLSRDTDYIAIEGVDNCFSINYLHVDTFSTKVYDKTYLANHLKLDELYLPLLATLCGNDFLTDDDLHSFHLSLLRDLPNFHQLEGAIYLQKKLIFPKVAAWIMQNTSRLQHPSTWPSVLANSINAPHLKEKLSNSIKSYLPIAWSESTFGATYGDWPKILRLAEQRHREGADASILPVLTLSKCYYDCRFELMSSTSSLAILKPLRRRLYGVLLKERPAGPCCVTEYVCSCYPTLAYYEYPDVHPGLLVLWSNGNLVKKIKILCWAISSKLKTYKVLSIPEKLRISYLTLFYLAREVKSGVKRWHIEALAVHLIRLTEIPLRELESIPCGVPDMLEIHIATLFIRAWQHVLVAFDICGFKLFNGSDQVNNVFFHGKLFNSVFKARQAMPDEMNCKGLCNADAYTSFIDFLYYI